MFYALLGRFITRRQDNGMAQKAEGKDCSELVRNSKSA